MKYWVRVPALSLLFFSSPPPDKGRKSPLPSPEPLPETARPRARGRGLGQGHGIGLGLGANSKIYDFLTYYRGYTYSDFIKF